MVGCSLEQLAVPWSPRRIAEKYSILQNAIDLKLRKKENEYCSETPPPSLFKYRTVEATSTGNS
jgi:hypothetical protein